MADQTLWGDVKFGGGNPEDFDAVITNVRFLNDPEDEYNGDRVRFAMDLVPDIDGESEELIEFLTQIKRDAWEVQVNCGSIEKLAYGDGSVLTDTNGNTPKVHGSSGFATIIQSLGSAEGAVDHITTSPFEAATYEGLQVRFGRSDVRKGGGDVADYTQMIITEVRGRQGAPAPKAVSNAATTTSVDKLADAHSDYSEFLAAYLDGEAGEPTDEVTLYVQDTGEQGAWNMAVARAS